MKVLIQRSRAASVSVAGKLVGEIRSGLVLFAAVQKHDEPMSLEKMAEKVLSYRLFSDADDKMNLNVKQVGGALLVVSQFTLAADTKKGLRPSFSCAAPPELAREYFDLFVSMLRERHPMVETGVFGADMQVALTNDGPVTFMLEN